MSQHEREPSPEPDTLSICDECSSGLVYPTEWDDVKADELEQKAKEYGYTIDPTLSSNYWEVAVRCPECEHCKMTMVHQSVVVQFDEDLDRGTEQLVASLKSLMHTNMEEYMNRFVMALETELILPEDF